MANLLILWLAIAGLIVVGTLRFIAIDGKRNEHGFPASRRLYRNKKRAGRE